MVLFYSLENIEKDDGIQYIGREGDAV